MEKSQGVVTDEIIINDANIFASEWDLYDTYKGLSRGMFKLYLINKINNILKKVFIYFYRFK